MIPPKGVCALTGVHGYVGSTLRRALQSAGWNVLALSRTATPETGEIPWTLEGMEGAVRRRAISGSTSGGAIPRPSIEDEFRERGVSALVHAAWDMRLVKEQDLQRVNVEGSLRLLAQAQAANLQRVVFISSISAFDGVLSLYGRTKVAVERATLASGGVVLRPGMVYGIPAGGMFAALQRQAGRAPVMPLIGNGSYPQYLVHQDDLAAVVLAALACAVPPGVPVTVAHPRPWPLRDLISKLALAQGRTPRFVPIPWRVLYYSLRVTEALGLKAAFRSDSIFSLVHQNPHPVMNTALLGVEPRPFSGKRLNGDL